MIKRIVSIFTVVILVLVLSQPSFGQTDAETQKRLQEVESKRASSSASSSATKKTTYSFVEGSITSLSNPIIMIETETGAKTIHSYESTKYINLDNSGKKLIGFGDLKLGEKIQVLGLAADATSGIAQIIVRDTVSKTSNFALLSKFSEIKDNFIYLKDFNRQDLTTIKVGLNNETQIKKGNQTLSVAELKIDQTLVVVGKIDDKGSLTATEIRVVN